MGRSHFSFDGERKVCKRKPAARRLQRRPTSLCTAAKPRAALGLGYALHGFQPFLALVGLRPPLAVGFGLREPNGWMPRINSGHPIPALRPEQSDHVPWADCPQGLSSSTGCPVSHSSLPVALLASHPPCGSLWAAPKAPLGPRFPSGQFAALTRREKALDCPFCRRGSLCRAHPNWQNFTCYRARSELAFFRRQNGRAFFPPLPIAALLPRSWHWADSKKCKLGCFGRDWVASQRQKASFFFSL